MNRWLGEERWEEHEGDDEGDHPVDAPEDPPRRVDRSGTRGRSPFRSDLPPCETFEDVYARYKGFAWSTVRAQVPDDDAAADVVQNAFVTVSRKIGPGGQVTRDHERMLPSILRGAVHDFHRAQARRRVDAGADADEVPASRPDPEQLLLIAELDEEGQAACAQILGGLSPYEQQVLRLDHADGLTYREIGVLVGRAPGTVGVDLQRARAKIMKRAERFKDLLMNLWRNKR